MAKVVDIERVRADRLAADLLPAIREAFAGPGMLKVSTTEIEDVERWRRAARACARKLGVSVQHVGLHRRAVQIERSMSDGRRAVWPAAGVLGWLCAAGLGGAAVVGFARFRVNAPTWFPVAIALCVAATIAAVLVCWRGRSTSGDTRAIAKAGMSAAGLMLLANCVIVVVSLSDL